MTKLVRHVVKMLRLDAAGCLWPAIIWALYFGLVYAWQGITCHTVMREVALGGIQLPRLGLILIWLLALGLMLAVAWQAWRKGIDRMPAANDEDAADRGRFLRQLSLLLAGIFLLALLWIGWPALAVDPCIARYPLP